MSALNIEKNNLEAHTELCGERYDNLNYRLEQIDGKMKNVEINITDIKKLITDTHTAREETMIDWSKMLIFSLTSALGVLIFFILTHKIS